MRTTSIAAFAAAAALAAGLAPTLAAPAAATPTTAPPTVTSGGTGTPAPATVESLVQALRDDLGLTPEQFLAQASVGERLSRAQKTWATQFRKGFGGAWLDTAGRGTVGVAPGADAAALRKAATGAGFTVRDVALTTDQLAEREKKVAAVVAGLPDAQKALVTGVRQDPARGTVVVTTKGGTQSDLGNLTGALRDLAVVETQDAPSPDTDTAPFGSEGGKRGTGSAGGQEGTPATTQNRQPAAQEAGTGPLASLGELTRSGLIPEGPARTVIDLLSTLGGATGSIIDGMNEQVPNPATPRAEQRQAVLPASDTVAGGTAFDVPADNGLLECSTGFNGELGGKPVVITAAHCAGKEGARATMPGAGEFGTMSQVRKPGIDTALITVDDAKADRFRNNLVGNGSGTTQAITGTARPVAGQKACKMGSRTGFSCGTIDQVDARIDVGGTRTIDRGFTLGVCALPGDSGGVVFSGDKALGVSSASNVAGSATCDRADAEAKTGGYTPRLSAVPIDDVLAAHPGLTLRTS